MLYPNTEDPCCNDSFCPPQNSAIKKEFAAIKNPNMSQYDKKPFIPLFTPGNIYCGYLLESPHQGDCNKYPQHMVLGVLNTVFIHISNYLPHLELRNRSIVSLQ